MTTTTDSKQAIDMLRANPDAFDIVLSDVYMPDINGFKLLEAVGLEMGIPVIMMSTAGDTEIVMEGIVHGAVDYLLKPVRIEELQNIWQHVVRRQQVRKDNDDPAAQGPDGAKRKKDGAPSKKQRVVWSVELHQKFVNAVNTLGIDKAVPKRILDLMCVSGLTRENVASHLQKYRLYLKRIAVQQGEEGREQQLPEEEAGVGSGRAPEQEEPMQQQPAQQGAAPAGIGGAGMGGGMGDAVSGYLGSPTLQDATMGMGMGVAPMEQGSFSVKAVAAQGWGQQMSFGSNGAPAMGQVSPLPMADSGMGQGVYGQGLQMSGGAGTMQGMQPAQYGQGVAPGGATMASLHMPGAGFLGGAPHNTALVQQEAAAAAAAQHSLQHGGGLGMAAHGGLQSIAMGVMPAPVSQMQAQAPIDQLLAGSPSGETDMFSMLLDGAPPGVQPMDAPPMGAPQQMGAPMPMNVPMPMSDDTGQPPYGAPPDAPQGF